MHAGVDGSGGGPLKQQKVTSLCNHGRGRGGCRMTIPPVRVPQATGVALGGDTCTA